MNTYKQFTGVLLLALAGAGWYFWKKRQEEANCPDCAAKKAAAAAGGSGSAGSGANLAGLQQVGSNYNQNISADVIGQTLAFASELLTKAGPCWVLTTRGSNGYDIWDAVDASGTVHQSTTLVKGMRPTSNIYPVCG